MHRPSLGRVARASVAAALVLLLLGAGAWLVSLRAPEPVVELRSAQSRTIGAVHFGGPDRPPGALRSLLLQKVRSAPPGSAIDWATYYFLDRELAQALIDASDRGVKVILVVEGDPRLDGANDPVLDLLKRDGLRGGLTVRAPRSVPADRLSGKLHSKIYAFSAPEPVALVGSFNPSDGGYADSATIREIGDQDRGHNLLVEIVSPALAATLAAQVRRLAGHGGEANRFATAQNRTYRHRDTQLYFYPRLRPNVVERAVDGLGQGDRLWAAVSHLKDDAVDTLAQAAARGAKLHLIVHDTERRVPEAAVRKLTKAGVSVRRYRQPDGLPMHSKFFLLQRGDERVSYFGSLNFNQNSRLLNEEVLIRSTDPALFRTLLQRFRRIEAGTQGAPPAALAA